MAGITKRKYEAENSRIAKSMTRQLNLIYEILPKEYDGNILLDYYKRYYPNEWNYIVERCRTYKQKNEFLLSHGKKSRYGISTPENFFFGLPKVKHILCETSKKKHCESYDEEKRTLQLNDFETERSKAIEKHNEKINWATQNQQHIDPLFISLLEYAYHTKGHYPRRKIGDC